MQRKRGSQATLSNLLTLAFEACDHSLFSSLICRPLCPSQQLPRAQDDQEMQQIFTFKELEPKLPFLLKT